MNNSLVTGRILLANADGTEKFTNESPGIVQLSGSIAEYGWIKGKTQPTPTEDIAIGIEFDTTNKTKTVYVWDNDTSSWVVM